MTEAEQIVICKVLAKSCMWGQGGIAAVILDGLERSMPMSWHRIYAENDQQARDDATGVVVDEAELRDYLARDYRLCNYRPGRMSLHRSPAHGGGLWRAVIGELAEKYGQTHDAWNYRVYQERAAAEGEK